MHLKHRNGIVVGIGAGDFHGNKKTAGAIALLLALVFCPTPSSIVILLDVFRGGEIKTGEKRERTRSFSVDFHRIVPRLIGDQIWKRNGSLSPARTMGAKAFLILFFFFFSFLFFFVCLLFPRILVPVSFCFSFLPSLIFPSFLIDFGQRRPRTMQLECVRYSGVSSIN